MGERVAGCEFHSALQSVASWFELVFGPFEESEISVRIFHARVQANGFPILSRRLGVLAETGKGNPAKIVNARIVRMVALRCRQLFESIRITIVLQRCKTPLKCVFLPGWFGQHVVGGGR